MSKDKEYKFATPEKVALLIDTLMTTIEVLEIRVEALEKWKEEQSG